LQPCFSEKQEKQRDRRVVGLFESLYGLGITAFTGAEYVLSIPLAETAVVA
jgi:hypothetical protein